MLSEIQVRPVRSLRTEDNEKWLTKKKVEIVTTKNVEKTIKRQLVLEDGRVLDEDVPIVTFDTTENKEIFETDHDETHNMPDYSKRAEMSIGDKVTTHTTTKDVKENVTKTEASQNMGSIATRDIAGVLQNKTRLSKVLRAQRPHSSYEVSASPAPVVLEASRSHRRVTDTKRLDERRVMRGSREVSERVRREEHEEYESGESATSDEGEDFEMIEYEELRQVEPREYKTKTEESFIEYFQKGQNKKKEASMVRPHLGTQSKQYNKNISGPRRQLQQSRSWDNDKEDKLSGVRALSRHQSNSLGDLSRNSSERVFIAKVIDETPTVKLRNKKKQDMDRHTGSHRRSAHATSASSSREYHFPNCRVKPDQRQRERPISLDITKFHFSRADRDCSSGYAGLHPQRNYHSSLDVSREPKQIEITIERPGISKLAPKHLYTSSDNLLRPASQHERQAVVTKSLVKKSGNFQSIGDICFTTSKEIPSPSREAIHRGLGTDTVTPRKSWDDRKASRREEAQLIFTSEKPHQPLAARRSLESSFKTSTCTNLSTRVIPIQMLSRPESPATKYRTRVAVHGAA